MKRDYGRAWDLSFLLSCIFALTISVYYFAFSGQPIEHESPFRTVAGSIFIFLLPGIIWAEVLGFRPKTPLENIALSFAITLTHGVLLLFVCLLSGATVAIWIALVFISSVTGLLVLAHGRTRGKGGYALDRLRRLPRQTIISSALMLGVLVFMSYSTYTWGEDVFDMEGEKLLHLAFIRHYYSLPLEISSLGIKSGTIPPKLVYFWEFLLAAWARLINMDPLHLFNRARFVIPILGFSGMYLLVRGIFAKGMKAEAITWGILIICLGGSPLFEQMGWDPTRGVMAFMGTVHHSDSAMDLLIALYLGIALFNLRNPGMRGLILFAGMTVTTFMWHPRELFQIMLYIGVFLLSIPFIRHINRRELFKRTALTIVVGVIVIAPFLLFTVGTDGKVSVGDEELIVWGMGHDEMRIKSAALDYAFRAENLAGVRSALNFPYRFMLMEMDSVNTIRSGKDLNNALYSQWQFLLIIVLSAIAIPFVSYLGDRYDRKLAVFFILLWFLTLNWNFGMFMVIVFTYSEFFMGTPRLLYIFSYIIAADFLYLITVTARRRLNIPIPALLVILPAMGLLFSLWIKSGMPYLKTVSWTLSLSALASLVFLALRGRAEKARWISNTPLWAVVLSMALFLAPLIGREQARTLTMGMRSYRPQINWFGDGNPLGFSAGLVDKIREMGPDDNVLVYPLGSALTPIYSPHNLVYIPISSLLETRKARREIINKRHPLYRDDPRGWMPWHALVINFLNSHKVDYIVIENNQYQSLARYFRLYPDDYSIIFDNPRRGEMVVMTANL